MTETEDEARSRASPVARAALLAYLLLIVYASWFPFSGWRSSGLSPFAFINLQPQRYWTGFDVMVNVVGYMPLGVLMVLSLHPLVRRAWAVLVASVGGILVSGTMEVVQNFLPSRVPSNLDLLTNSVGCMAGAVLGLLFALPPRRRPQSRQIHPRCQRLRRPDWTLARPSHRPGSGRPHHKQALASTGSHPLRRLRRPR